MRFSVRKRASSLCTLAEKHVPQGARAFACYVPLRTSILDPYTTM